MAAGAAPAPAKAGVAQVGGVGQAGGKATASVAQPASQHPILFCSARPSPHQDSRASCARPRMGHKQ